MKISRKKLITVAFDALDDIPDVSPEDRKHLLYAACTMDQVALGEWAIDDKCGCLVGTMLLNEGKTPDDICDRFIGPSRRGPLYSLGLRFDKLLRLHLQGKYGAVVEDDVSGVRIKVKD